MTRRTSVAALGLLGALLAGGVSQTFLWRWGLDGVSHVTNSQFLWVLLTFGVAWGWAEGLLGQGAAAGALTGLALIASYYMTQWLADGRHAALAQFSKTGGMAWTVAAVGGGAAMGLCGALAGMDARERPRLKAIGITIPAVIVVAGPVLWVLAGGAYLDPSRLLPAVGVFVLAGVVLLVVAVRTCGPLAVVQGVAISATCGAAALGALLVLQTQGWLYLTF